MKNVISALLACDSYKLAHRNLYPEGTELVYSNFTPRSDKHLNVPDDWKDGNMVVAGVYGMVREIVELWDETFFKRDLNSVLDEYREAVAPFCGLAPENVEVEHLEYLHKLGYLPLKIKALDEGLLCPMKVPVLSVRNTDPKCFWLTNFIETMLSAEGWKTSTAATLAYALRRVLTNYAKETGAPLDFVPFQGHDFSMRGMSGTVDAARTGYGHLMSFVGSDTILAAQYAKKVYGATGLVACSVPASEHSVATMGGVEGEYDILDRIIFDVHPTGIVSVVSDSYDLFRVLTDYVSSRKDRILARTPNEMGLAKVVFRPDSGDPVKILTGYKTYVATGDGELAYNDMDEILSKGYEVVKVTGFEHDYYEVRIDTDSEGFNYVDLGRELSEPEVKGAVECLWDVFGGTETEKGYKLLNERVGLIYGDSITVSRAEEISQRLMAKGFASTNCVYRVGSYTYQFTSRDSLGMAMKATYGVVNGQGREIFKDPKTDQGKKSAKGLLKVNRNQAGVLELFDQVSWEEEATGELRTMFEDGAFNEEYVRDNTLNMSRARLAAAAGW